MTFTPLATSADFKASAYANMASTLQNGELDRIMAVATRDCESACDNRMAPFTLTESLRLTDTDVDDVIPNGIIVPPNAQLGLDYARALQTPTLIRGFQVRNYPKVYSDLWNAAAATSVSITLTWAVQHQPFVILPTQIQFFPDTGLGQFTLGTFAPPGATALITYSGGYTTVPDDLKQAALHMAASELAHMLDPVDANGADPDKLRTLAIKRLRRYGAKFERK